MRQKFNYNKIVTAHFEKNEILENNNNLYLFEGRCVQP